MNKHLLVFVFFFCIIGCTDQNKIESKKEKTQKNPSYVGGECFLILRDTVTVLDFSVAHTNIHDYADYIDFKLLGGRDYFNKTGNEKLQKHKDLTASEYIDYRVDIEDFRFRLNKLLIMATDGKTKKLYKPYECGVPRPGSRSSYSLHDFPAYYVTWFGADSIVLKNGFVAWFTKRYKQGSSYVCNIDSARIGIYGKKQTGTSFGKPVYKWTTLSKTVYARSGKVNHICFGVEGFEVFLKRYGKYVESTDKPFLFVLKNVESGYKTNWTY